MTLRRPPSTTPALYAQDGAGMQAIVHAHYFIGGCDWLVTEYNPADDLAFGWACMNDPEMAELGYVSLAEMDAVRVGDLNQAVEFDQGWTPRPLETAIAEILGRHGWTTGGAT